MSLVGFESRSTCCPLLARRAGQWEGKKEGGLRRGKEGRGGGEGAPGMATKFPFSCSRLIIASVFGLGGGEKQKKKGFTERDTEGGKEHGYHHGVRIPLSRRWSEGIEHTTFQFLSTRLSPSTLTILRYEQRR